MVEEILAERIREQIETNNNDRATAVVIHEICTRITVPSPTFQFSG